MGFTYGEVQAIVRAVQASYASGETANPQAAVHRHRGENGENKEKVRQDGWVESSGMMPAHAATTSAFESGTPLAPPSALCGTLIAS